ncbi:MAG: type II toxin-antitoxin system VapC family toxin [Anaerolineae bacterium]|nr:type II toxin-antitoxin system VapC family toxin [Anaerolineae bacterium]
MSIYFLDSSALIKRYLAENGSDWVSSISTANHNIVISPITGIEIVAALARRGKTSAIAQQQAQIAIQNFYFDSKMIYREIEAKPELFSMALQIAESGFLRGCDAIQLGCALLVERTLMQFSTNRLIFVAADNELLNAAVHYGLQVDNPLFHL